MLKKLIMTLALCISALLLLCAAGCGASGAGGAGEAEEHTALPVPEDTIAEDPQDASATFREATLYYVSDEGYVVPVKQLIPWEEGIAKACLGYLTSTPANDSAAAVMGLNTVLPAGTDIALSIQNGEATLDLIGLSPLASAKAEEAMLSAVVDTLTEFSTVDTVTVLKDGRGGVLENGTELPQRSARRNLNIEDTELAASAGSVAGTLYFPNSSGALTIPVTRYFGSEPSLYAKVSALISGPVGGDLMCCFPKGTLLLGAAYENGTVTVNLSEDFKAVEDTPGMYTLAVRTLGMTLAEQLDFNRLTVQVNGALYAPEEVSD